MGDAWLDRVRRGLREHEDEREAVVAGDTDAGAGPPAADGPAGGDARPPAATRAPSGGSGPGGREAPASIGPYRIVGELGRGGAGVVYVARSEALDRLVAVKVLRHEREVLPELRERFDVEARAAARLRHPNIVAVHDAGEDAGRRYLVMELVPGRSLAARLRGEGPLAPRVAARLIERVALALEHAHARGILHRDLKPHNVLLDGPGPDAEPLLSDFGLAKLADAGASPTVSGQVMGTPAYMSPEQARGAHDRIDRRSDVWGLGATLHEALTGRPPADGTTALAVLGRLTDPDPIPPVSSLAPGLPPDLVTIVGKALEKDPADRYVTAADLASDLRRFLADEPIAARPPGPVERARKWARRNPAQARGLLVTAAVALVAGAASTARFLERMREETARAAAAAREAADQAARARARAAVAQDALRALVAAVDDELAPLPGAPARAVRQDLLARARDGLTRLRDAELAGGGPPTVGAAEAQRQLAAILRAQVALDGDLAPALDAWARAVDLARACAAETDGEEGGTRGDDADPARRAHHGLVAALVGLGEVELARGDAVRARAHLEEALVRGRSLVARLGAPDTAAVDARVAASPGRPPVEAPAAPIDTRTQAASAAPLDPRAATARPTAPLDGLRADDLPSAARRDLARAARALAAIDRAAGRADPARERLRLAVELGRDLARRRPDDVRARGALASDLEGLAQLTADAGRPDEARALRDEARPSTAGICLPGPSGAAAE